MSAAAAGGAAAAVVVINNNRRIREEREAYQRAVDEERDNLVRLMEKHAAFHEAAEEMLGEIPRLARIPQIRGAQHLSVRHGIFSFRPKPVPEEVLQWANDHVRPIL